MKVTVLGCGSSAGVPVIGCGCAVCASDNPRNKRLRASLLAEFDDGFRLLVDMSPDLRQQALRHDIATVDAIVVTHAHADHIHGIDDVRSFNINRRAEIDVYTTAAPMQEMQERFPYVWGKPPEGSGYWARAALEGHIIGPGDALALSPQAQVQTFRQIHGRGESLGLRFGDVVYSTDLNAIPQESEPLLHNMEVWIVDCLRDGFSGSHTSLEMALAWIETYKPKRAILTHMNHELEYEALKKRIPAHVEPAFDGMVIEL